MVLTYLLNRGVFKISCLPLKSGRSQLRNMAKFSLYVFLILLFYIETTLCSPEHKWKPFRNRKQRDFARSLPDFRVITPYISSRYGSVLTYNLDKFSDRSEMFYVIKAFGQELLLEMTRNKRLVASNFASETMLNSRDYFSNVSSSCYFTGKVKGINRSSAAISNCHGLVGIIRTGYNEYFIEPMAKGRRNFPHLIYKRSALPAHQSRGEPTSCGSRDKATFSNSSHIWKPSNARAKRSVVSEATVQVLVVIDKEMIEFHGKDHVEEYVLTVMNMVSEIYRQPSIGMSINIEVVRLVLLHEIPKELSVTHNGDQTLQSFCDWQHATNWRVSPGSHEYLEYDTAMLLTRKDICADRNSPCGTVGMAFLYGMCDSKRRCSVSEDNGLNLAFTVAHELGHNFGLHHDGDGNSCAESSNSVPHLMSAQWMSNNKHGTMKWSKCSQAGLQSFLRSKDSKCLRNPSSQRPLNLPQVLPGVSFSADQQCVHQYGHLARQCSKPAFRSLLCRQLWCEIKGEALCRSRQNPPAKGTPCAPGKWCVYGSCVSNTTIPERRDGGWGKWSDWSACSRTCGMGISTMERKCNKPSPRNGGRFCTGKQKKFRTCNTKLCPKGSHDFRKIQCATFNGTRYKGKKHSWVPVYSSKNPCALYCKPVDSKYHFSAKLAEKVIDGTPCTVGGNDICIDGRCQEVGCDRKLGSPAREDMCGVCNGNGTTCYVVEGSFNQIAGSGYVRAAMIPKGATSIQVSEIKPCSSFLAVRSNRGRYYINGNWKIQLPGDVFAEETLFHYKRKGLWESIKAKGPTTFPIDIMVLYHGFNLGIKYRYALPLNSTSTVREEISGKFRSDGATYGWIHGGWGPCSVHCGGGIMKSLKMRCIRAFKGNVSFVDDHFCKGATKSSREVRVCNEQKCPIWWSVSPWQPCSKTCGMGMRRRRVRCKQQLRNGTETDAANSLCPSDKPSGVQICILRACSLQWTVGPWSKECIALCGSKKGYHRRKVRCPVSGMCSGIEKPSTRKPCVSIQPCFHSTDKSEKLSDLYKWVKGEWTQCSVTCDEGVQRRLVKCRHTRTGELIERCRSKEKPLEIKRCSMPPCKGQCLRNKYLPSGCRMVVTLGLCKKRRWFDLCCQSCQELDKSDS